LVRLASPETTTLLELEVTELDETFMLELDATLLLDFACEELDAMLLLDLAELELAGVTVPEVPGSGRVAPAYILIESRNA
jgi:hypothetical protein